MAAPKGNQNAAKAREWADTLKHELAEYQSKKRRIERGQALRAVARLVIEEALDGGMWAVQEIGNRLDGKAAQAVELSGSIEHKHVREMSDAEIVERLQRIRAADGALEAQEGETIIN